jgi:DNA-binding NtrC family response regulator
MNDRKDDEKADEVIIVEPTTQRDREVTQQLEQAVSRVRRAKAVLDRARESEGQSGSGGDGYDTDRLSRSRVVAGSRVLLVDDEDVIRRLMSRMVEGHGCTCTSAASGEEAGPLLESQAFDLLIVDKNLPGISGVEVAKLARKLQPGVPVLMITGYASEESAREAAAYGVSDYILKPIDLEDFRRRMIHSLMSKRRGRSSSPSIGRRISEIPAPRRRKRGRTSRPSSSGISAPPRPVAAMQTGPLNVEVLLYDPSDESRKRLEEILKPCCSKLSLFSEAKLALTHLRNVGFDVMVAVPEFLGEVGYMLDEAAGRTPLGSIAIMDRGGIDKAIEAIQLGARGSLHAPFDEEQTRFEFRRTVNALLDERRR